MICVGIDLVQVSRIAESLAQFGDRFLRRVFTDSEIAYATATPAQTAQRLAARFAAKEAAKKALTIPDDVGIGWCDIEVVRTPSGACKLRLHGDAARLAGAAELTLSMSHEGDFATAVVVTNTGTSR